MAIGGGDRGGCLDLDALCLAAAGDDHVDFHLVLVAIVPEAQVGIGPAGLGDELLDHEGFQQMAEAVAPGVPVDGLQAAQGRRQTAVDPVDLGGLDEALGFIAVPRGQQADQEQALEHGEVVFHRPAVEFQLHREGGDVQEFAAAQGGHFQQP